MTEYINPTYNAVVRNPIEGRAATIGDVKNIVEGASEKELPEVDSTDNGKVLAVVEGEWAAAEPSSGCAFTVVHYTVSDGESGYTVDDVDMDPADIIEAAKAGPVVAISEPTESTPVWERLNLTYAMDADGELTIGFGALNSRGGYSLQYSGTAAEGEWTYVA